MKKVWLLFFLCIFGTHNLMAETCIGKNWTVSYSCGKGTVKNKLPENQVATYGSEFTPVLLNTEYCTPPSGMAISGIEIWVGDSDNGACSKTGAKFMYYYASDVVIKPRYMGVADINKLWVLRGFNGESRTYNASGRTWQAVFPYGTVSGIAACSNVKPKNSSPGWTAALVAEDQSAITEEGGRFCYCKMTEPHAAASPWVFMLNYENASMCFSGCASSCGFYTINAFVFRTSLFLGAKL